VIHDVTSHSIVQVLNKENINKNPIGKSKRKENKIESIIHNSDKYSSREAISTYNSKLHYKVAVEKEI